MAANFLTTFSNAFSWIEIHQFWWRFHWFQSLFSNEQYSSIGSDNGLVPNRRQANIWTNADPIHWRIYAALGGDKLTHSQHILSSTVKPSNTFELILKILWVKMCSNVLKFSKGVASRCYKGWSFAPCFQSVRIVKPYKQRTQINTRQKHGRLQLKIFTF